MIYVARVRRSALFVTAASLLLLLLPLVVHADDALWTRHRSFEDFREGTLPDGGQNVYVSRSGRLQTINRQDLNLDGEIDLLFTQDHDHVYAPDALLYWGSPEGFHSLLPELWRSRSPFSLLRWQDEARKRITRLPASGGGRAVAVDLNADDYPDIVFTNMMHNYRPDQPAYVYWGDARGFSSDRRTELPAFLASGVAVGDLNGDTIPEIVLSNRGDERGHIWGLRFHREAYIYWGSADGYAVSRRTSLESSSAADVAMGDFNGDGAPDLAFANSNYEEQSVYVYWNDGEGGFTTNERQVIDQATLQLEEQNVTRRPGLQSLLAADLDGDGVDELVVGGEDKAIGFYGTKVGLDFTRPIVLPVNQCRGLAASDLNGDRRPDLIVGNYGEDRQEPPASSIFWASAKGYSAENRTDLPTLGAKSVDVADLNGDGRLDILFANAHDIERSDVPSYVYWGGPEPEGYAAYRRSELFAFGPEGSAVADFNRDGRQDVLLVSHLSGYHGALPAVVYWGNPGHYYSAASMTKLGVQPPMEHSVADLDDDGFPDLVFLSDRDRKNALVWWGAAGGFTAGNLHELGLESPMSCSIADLNQDGHLDILFTKPGRSLVGPNADVIILWGDGRRFAGGKTTQWKLGSPHTEANAIADLNRDGHLDLIFPLGGTEHSEIYWGSSEGYRQDNHTALMASGAPHVVVADLDNDEWLDLVFTSGAINKRFTVNTPSYVYWGSAEGYSGANRITLEGYTGLDATVSDFDRDGRLDIAMSNYRSDTNRKVPTFIYWGTDAEERVYTDLNRTLLRSGSGSAIAALDLNRDGWDDLVVSNHQFNFDHAGGTDIFWGGPQGFSLSRRHQIPTVGVHLDSMVDAGHVYDRGYEWDYISSAIEAPAKAQFARLHWSASTELGTGVKFQVRTASAANELEGAPWRGPSGFTSYYEKTGTDLDATARAHRFLQYRAVLASPDGANTAYVSEVAVECVAAE